MSIETFKYICKIRNTFFGNENLMDLQYRIAGSTCDPTVVFFVASH